MRTAYLVGIILLTGLMIGAPVHAATYDLSGNWQCTFTGAWASGDIGCSTGPNPSSSCTIEQIGDSFTLVLYTTCEPAFSCTFYGSVSGAAYTGSNSGPLDGGGTVTNTVVFTASSTTEASGSGFSEASFPDWNCTWGFTSLVLTRDAVDPSMFTLTVNVSGSGSVTADPDGGVYSPGTTVHLTAVPDSGWRFVSWGGDADGAQNAVDIFMDKDKVVNATFALPGRLQPGVLHLLFGD